MTEKIVIQQNPIEFQQPAFSADQDNHLMEKCYRVMLDFLPYPVVVLNLDSTVFYLNPAFTNVFGWTLEELKGKQIPFVPDFLKEQTYQEMQCLLQEHVIHGIETKRLTKDGQMLDMVCDGVILYEEGNKPAAQMITLRDVTREKRIAQSHLFLSHISQKLHHFQRLDELLEFVAKEVKTLINAEGAMVILLDEGKKEFFFRVATLDDLESGKKMKEVRFPMDKGVAGYVYKTGAPLIVPDTSKSPYFFRKVDEDAGYQTRSMLDVPIETQDRRIGVLCAVNKKDGEFTQEDVELLSTIASTIAFPIENARISEKLKSSYEEVQSLNRAKDRIIHYLSHELNPPVSVLSASLNLLAKRLANLEDQGYKRLLERAQRNLQRILEMQYEIEDLLRERDYPTYQMLSILLDACVDELDVLISDELGEWNIMQRIRRRVEELFGPQESISRTIHLDQFVEENLEALHPRFAHRTCQLALQVESTPPILIPPEVLTKIVEGLIRNAVENTPDGGKIEVTVRNGKEGPEFEVKDFGIGITEENQRLIFENYFPSYETIRYASRTPYDFNAGGKGFDLLRMKIFSERYHFKLSISSKRCRYIPHDEDVCPGKIEHCAYCRTEEDCIQSGGTTVMVQFIPTD